MYFFTFFILLTFRGVVCEDKPPEPAKFKIIVVVDQSPMQQTVMTYLNYSTSYITENMVEFIDIKADDESSIESIYKEICQNIEQGAQFLIGSATNSTALAALKRVVTRSDIPAILIDWSTWQYPSAESLNVSGVWRPGDIPAESSYAWFVPPPTTMLTVVDPFNKDLNFSIPRAVVLYDDLFTNNLGLDQTTKLMLSKAGLSKRISIQLNESLIVSQFIELMEQGITTIFLMCKAKNIETYIAKVSSYFTGENAEDSKREPEYRKVGWVFYSKDTGSFPCDNCATIDFHWIRPSTGEQQFNRLDMFKTWWRDPDNDLAQQDLVMSYQDVDASFYLDVVALAWQYIKKMNVSIDIYPIYECNRTVVTSIGGNTSIPTLTEFILDNDESMSNFQGTFGSYEFYAPRKVFQNLKVSIVKSQFEEDARYSMKVANYTAPDGVTVRFLAGIDANIANINTYRVTIVVQPPFIEKVINAKGDTEYRGYCIDLINKIAAQVGFKFDLFEVKDKTYGAINDQGEWNGLIRELINGDAEIALAPLSVMAERENVVDFTVPYYDLVGTTILMKKTEPDYSLFKFMTVLEGPVWGCIVAAYFFTSFLLWLFDRFSPYSYTNNKDKYKDDPEKREFTLKECLWFCMTSLTPQGGGEAPKNISGRLVAATWWLFGFIIIASYTANLAAFLTVSRLETPISSLDDLAKQYKIKYAPVKGTASETYFKRMAEIEERFYGIWKSMSLNESMSPQERAQLAVWDYPVSDKFTNMWRYMQEAGLPNTTEDAIKRVLDSPSPTEGFAYIGDATEIRYAELTNCKLQQVGSEFSRKPYAIAVQQGSPLKDKISSAILKLLNQRDLEHLKERWWNQNPNKQDCPKQEDESDGISIQNIGGVFIVILVGIALSIITLAFEYWYYKDRRHPGQGNDQDEKEKQANGLAVINSNGEAGKDQNQNIETTNGAISMGQYNGGFDTKE